MHVPNSGRRPPTVGYLAVIEDEAQGFTGGLLVVSATGRPLEFHCSTPTRVTRAQQILFGATLRAHVCGELIATALLAAAKIKPSVLLVQHADAAPPEPGVPTLLASAGAAPGDDTAPAAPSAVVVAGGADPDEVAAAEQLLEELQQQVELTEPFERVHEAIREAQRMSGQEAPASDAA